MLVLKFALLLVAIGGFNMMFITILSSMNALNSLTVMFICLEILGIVGFIVIKLIVKPLSDLHKALSYIDFDKDIIDFSKLDCLEPSGLKEVKFTISKFKYLLDIITERINRVNSETYKSEHDGLTGCYNRVRLENMKSTYEVAQSVAIIFIDVNNLKKMNDIFGHEAGDSLLKAAAHKLNFWNNHGDVYRMGGDEFMIVVINKKPDYVERLIRQWYPTVGQLNRDTDGFRCVLSYGTAYGYQGCNFDNLQKQADENMYTMKVAIKKKFGEPMR